MNPRVRVVTVCGEEPAEGVFHRARRGCVDVALDGGQVDDVFAKEIVWHQDSVRENLVEDVHRRLRPILDPPHIAFAEIVEYGDVVLLENGQIVIQIFALERIGHHRLVLHARDVCQARLAQRENRTFELPRGRVGARKRIVPRDVVLEDRGLVRRQGGRHLGERTKALDVRKDRFGMDSERCNFRFGHGWFPTEDGRGWQKCK